MAVLAHSSGLNMRYIFASCVRAVMAAGAISGNARMIEVGGRPGDRSMTIIAVVATRQMSRVFSGCSDAIVTRAATAEYLRMVHGVGR